MPRLKTNVKPLGVVLDFERKDGGGRFPNFPMFIAPGPARLFCGYADHAVNSVSRSELFLGLDLSALPKGARITGGTLRATHRTSTVRYNPDGKGRSRFLAGENDLVCEVVEIGGYLDVGDRLELKPGAEVGRTDGWPRGPRGTGIEIALDGFAVASGDYALRLRSAMQSSDSPEWVGRESWVETFVEGGFALDLDYAEAAPADDGPTPEMIADFFQFLTDNPDMLEIFISMAMGPGGAS